LTHEIADGRKGVRRVEEEVLLKKRLIATDESPVLDGDGGIGWILLAERRSQGGSSA
jgi:hypothetical protein